MSWYPDRLLRALLGWTLFTAALPTIITYRAGVQSRYEWGLYGLTGRGVGLNYLIVATTAILAWSVVVLGYRGAGRPFAALFLLWHTCLLAAILYGVARFGDEMTIRGDAMHLSINVSLVLPLIGIAVLGAGIYWLATRGRRPVPTERLAWRRSARPMAIVAGVLGLAIIVLFRQHSGHPHYDTDRAAILLIVAQVLVIEHFLKPPRPRLTGSLQPDSGEMNAARVAHRQIDDPPPSKSNERIAWGKL